MIDGIRLEHDSDGYVQSWTLVLEVGRSDHRFLVDPAMLDEALHDWRMGELQGEIVRREREAAGNITLTEYRCPDPESDFFEWAREAGDLHRKAVRERGSEQFDPGDENDRAA